MDSASKIYVAGHRGMVGSALVRRLRAEGHENLVLRTKDELDLMDQRATNEFFKKEKPAYVFLAAAKVGGIYANSRYPADFLHQNLAIQTNVIHQAWKNGTRKLVFLGSSCIYPRDCPQPIKEEALLTGPLEATNEAYAVAKIAGVKMCQAYRRQHGFDAVSAMPTNLYGPGDNYDLRTSHVLAALVRKVHDAVQAGHAPLELWGTGRPRREFLHVDDFARACLLLMERDVRHDLVNIGYGSDLTIRELAALIQKIAQHEGPITFDATKPDGTPRKLLDSSRALALGWKPTIALEDGIRQALQDCALRRAA